jgi:hypothetical protein
MPSIELSLPPPRAEAQLDRDTLLPDRKVRERYGGISEMTLYRWDHDPSLGFPPPIRINGRKYRRLAALCQWERSRLESPAA